MDYDFSTILNRSNTGSAKWDEMVKYNIMDPQIIPLSSAEMEFRNAPEIIDGLRQYLGSAILSYYDPLPSYFEAVRNWFGRRHKFAFDNDCIIPNVNLHSAVCTAVCAYSDQNDGIIVFQPCWPGFQGAVKATERTLLSCELTESEGKYTIDFERFELLTENPRAKALLLCSPHNPVGRVWKYEELKKIAEICEKNHIVVVSDEIHADLTLPGYHHIPIATISEASALNTVTFTGASKAFNLAGLDTSNIIIQNKTLREKFIRAKRSFGLGFPNMLGLKACELAYTRGEPWLNECIKVIADNADYVTKFLRDRIPVLSCTVLEGSYLMWLDFRKLEMDCKILEEALMHDAKLFMDDGYYFGDGGEGFIRMNIACPHAVLHSALHRLESWVNSLKDKSERLSLINKKSITLKGGKNEKTVQ